MPDDDTPPEDVQVICAGGVELRPLGATDGQYDRGGWLPPGLSLARNTTGQPEGVTDGE